MSRPRVEETREDMEKNPPKAFRVPHVNFSHVRTAEVHCTPLLGHTRRCMRQEFKLSAYQQRGNLMLREETNFFSFASWCTSTGVILHLIFGTMVLSGTLFVCGKEAVMIGARLLLSTLACRAILTYEIRGLRGTVTSEIAAGPPPSRP